LLSRGKSRLSQLANQVEENLMRSFDLPDDSLYIRMAQARRQPAPVLYLSAQPAGSTALRVDREAREIEDQIRLARYRDAIAFRSAWAVSRLALLRELTREDPVVVHFGGHGGGGDVVLEGPDGQPEPVSAQALSDALRSSAPNTRLVVLNACHSLDLVEALATHVPCTIAMAADVTDQAAIRYAAALYGALAFGKSIAQAHAQGLAALGLEGSPDAALPVLTCRRDVDPTAMFLVEPLMPAIGGELGARVAFLRGITRRDNLVGRLPPELAGEISALDPNGTALEMILAAQVYLVGQVGPHAARFAVVLPMVPVTAGSRYSWFSALQLAAMKSPVTLGAILLEVRQRFGVELPLCSEVLELLCEREVRS
jgi:hypothetical protein